MPLCQKFALCHNFREHALCQNLGEKKNKHLQRRCDRRLDCLPQKEAKIVPRPQTLHRKMESEKG